MKVIFFDIDGVLNSRWFIDKMWALTKEYRYDPIDPDAMKKLNIIVEKTGAKLVICSTWRYSHTVEELQTIFEKHGFIGEIIDTTDVNSHNLRGNDINKWICENHNVSKYCVIDDDNEIFNKDVHKFVHVSNLVGLTYKDVYKAISILNDTKISKMYSEFKLKRIAYYKKFIDFLYSFLYK